MSLVRNATDGSLPGLGMIRSAALVVGFNPKVFEQSLAKIGVSTPNILNDSNDGTTRAYEVGSPSQESQAIVQKFTRELASYHPNIREGVCPLMCVVELENRKPDMTSLSDELAKAWKRFICDRALPLDPIARNELVEEIYGEHEPLRRHIEGWRAHKATYRATRRDDWR